MNMKILVLLIAGFSCVKRNQPPSQALADNASKKQRLPTIAHIASPPDLDLTNERLNCPHEQKGLTSFDQFYSQNSQDVVIPEGKAVLIGDTKSQYQMKTLTIETGAHLIFADRDLELKVEDIKVFGQMSLGAKTCRLEAKIAIEFVQGEDPLEEIYARVGKGIMVGPKGDLDIHGKLYHHSWTFLKNTIQPGSKTLTLQKPVNWQPGQQIVVVTSSRRDYPFENQNEVMTLAKVADDGLTLLTKEPFSYSHYAGPEYQVEVGLLTRNIKLYATPIKTEEAKLATFGGHVMVMGNARLSGAEFYGMGQQNFLGRYPIHFHLSGAKPESYVTDNSIWNSHWRCVALHGTERVEVSRNVSFDVFGHCYYLEDGLEFDNTFSYNLAARVKVMGDPDTVSELSTGAQEGIVIVESETLKNPADRAAAGFYITNPRNRVFGNASSGGFAAYTFPNLPTPIGAGKGEDLVPKDLGADPEMFAGNFAHTSAYFWKRSGCAYFGGLLSYNEDGKLEYQTGRPSHEYVRKGLDYISHFKAALCEVGISHWGNKSELKNVEVHDSARFGLLFGGTSLKDVLFNGKTDNDQNQTYNTRSGFRRAFQTYDTASKTVIDTFHIANINRIERDQSDKIRSENNCAFYSMVHSNQFVPEVMTAIKGIHYYNVDDSQKICHDDNGTLSSHNFNILDNDGSLSTHNDLKLAQGPKLIGGPSSFWQRDQKCQYMPDWGVHICGNEKDQSAVALKIVPEDVQVYLYGDGVTDLGRRVTYPEKTYPSSFLAGPSSAGWHLFYPSPPEEVKISRVTLLPGQWVMVSLDVPKGSSCQINDGDGAEVEKVASLPLLQKATSTGFVHDEKDQRCYLKLFGDQNQTLFSRLGQDLPKGFNPVFYKSHTFTMKTGCAKPCPRLQTVDLPELKF